METRPNVEELEQSMALNELTADLIRMKDRDFKRIWVALILMILVNVAMFAGFLWYEAQFEYTDTVTTTAEVDQDSGLFGDNHNEINFK